MNLNSLRFSNGLNVFTTGDSSTVYLKMAPCTTLQNIAGYKEGNRLKTELFWPSYESCQKVKFCVCVSIVNKCLSLLRQVWTYCTLFKEVERFKRGDILQAAVQGGDFLMKYAKNAPTNKCYFSLTRYAKV